MDTIIIIAVLAGLAFFGSKFLGFVLHNFSLIMGIAFCAVVFMGLLMLAGK